MLIFTKFSGVQLVKLHFNRQNFTCVQNVLTEDDDLDDLSCNADGVLNLKRVVSCVVDGGLADDEVSVFSIAVNLDTVQAVLQFDATEVPGAGRLRSGLYGNVEVNGFSAMHMDDLLWDVGHVDLGHHWNTQKRNVKTIRVCFYLYSPASQITICLKEF